MTPKIRLRDIESDTIRVLSDRVKEELGYGLIHPFKLTPNKRCFLFHDNMSQLNALREVFPYCVGLLSNKWSNTWRPHVTLFEKDAIKALLKLAGIKHPSLLYQYGTSATTIIEVSDRRALLQD